MEKFKVNFLQDQSSEKQELLVPGMNRVNFHSLKITNINFLTQVHFCTSLSVIFLVQLSLVISLYYNLYHNEKVDYFAFHR